MQETPEKIYECAGNMIVLAEDQSLAKVPTREELAAITIPGKHEKLDQYITFHRLPHNVVEVKIWNIDGSEAKNCLNGMRALMNLLVTSFRVRSRIRFIQNGLILADGLWLQNQAGVEVDMPRRIRISDHIDDIHVGNEHRVHWALGEEIEKPPNYKPAKNEEYVTKRFNERFTARVFEAGAGETRSCGSGGVAIACAAWHRYGFSRSRIKFPGGLLQVKTDGKRMMLTGPTQQIVSP